MTWIMTVEMEMMHTVNNCNTSDDGWGLENKY